MSSFISFGLHQSVRAEYEESNSFAYSKWGQCAHTHFYLLVEILYVCLHLQINPTAGSKGAMLVLCAWTKTLQFPEIPNKFLDTRETEHPLQSKWMRRQYPARMPNLPLGRISGMCEQVKMTGWLWVTFCGYYESSRKQFIGDSESKTENLVYANNDASLNSYWQRLAFPHRLSSILRNRLNSRTFGEKQLQETVYSFTAPITYKFRKRHVAPLRHNTIAYCTRMDSCNSLQVVDLGLVGILRLCLDFGCGRMVRVPDMQ